MKLLIKIYIISKILLASSNLYGQTSKDTIVAKIYYKMNHIYDTTLINAPTNENMILFIGKQYSIFKSYDKMYNDSIMADGIKKGKDMLNYQTNGTRIASKAQFIKNNSSPFIVNEHQELIRNYLIRDNIEGLQQWQITNQIKKIESLTVTKATCNFRGRYYEAWFCPDIPIQNGPWKFGGLPGLILEITDSKKQVKFTFMGISNVANENLPMPQAPTKTVTTTLKDFEKIKEAKRNDPIAWINAALEDMGSDDRIGAINGETKNVKQPNRVNNPIQLYFDKE